MFARHRLSHIRCRKAVTDSKVSLICGAVCYRSSAKDDKDLMQQTFIPTLHFQKALPTLALPKLSDTIPKYLRAQRPLLDNSQYAHTEQLANAFIKEADNDQKELKAKWKRDKKAGTSYITAPWFEMYLRDRRAVALNHNPFMAFKDDPKAPYNDQVTRATNFVVSSLRFWKTYKTMNLEPEVFHIDPKKTDTDQYRKVMGYLPGHLAYYLSALHYKAYPLDMSQFPNLMNSTRSPRFHEDKLFSNTDSKDILVLRNGHYYTFPVLDSSGMIISPAEIKAHLQYISDDPAPPNEFPVGIMTSQDRDTWTVIRRKLMEANNEDAFFALDSAAFSLVLDDTSTEDPVELSKLFLHGNDGCNRWFDKSFSLIITKTGKSCVNFEHAWGDGVAVLRYFNEVYKETTQRPFVHPDTEPAKVDSASIVTKLEFNIPDDVKDTITTAKENFAKSTASVDLHAVRHERFGKKFLKKQNLSPDSFVQLVIQRAYYRQFGKSVATYESCSTSAFKHGRTETIRPCTIETDKCNQLFEDPSSSVQDLQKAIHACSSQHKQLTVAAATGKGFDRHLFALKDLVTKQDRKLHDFYKDPAYASMNHNILSTSTLSSPAVVIGGFCPVVPDGYGVGYGIDDDYIGAVVTTYPTRNGSDFVQAFAQSADEMHDILEGNDTRKKL